MRIRLDVAIVCLAIGLPRMVQGWQEPTVVEVAAVEDWALHAPSGRVFAAVSGGSQVVEYGRDGSEVRRFEVGADPTELIVKRNLLVVACTKSPSMDVIDLVKNAKVGTVALEGKGPYGLFCSQVDNGYVYCICNTGDAWWDGEVFQADLNSFQVRKRTKVRPWGQSHPLHVAMSVDGRWIVPDSRGATSPSGADLMEVNEEEATFRQVRDYHSSFGPIVAGPAGRYWTFGKDLYSLDIRERIRGFAGQPVAIHPSLDLAVSLAGNALRFERFSDAKPLATVAIPKAKSAANGRRPPARRAAGPLVAFGKDFAFLGDRTRAIWVDIEKLNVALDSMVIIRAPLRITGVLGDSLRASISITNDTDDLQLSVVNGPDNVEVSKQAIAWTPTAADVGVSELTLELKDVNGTRRDRVSIELEVQLPSVQLGFVPTSMLASPDGQRVVLWGARSNPDQRNVPAQQAEMIAVFDAPTSKLLASKPVPQGVRCAAIDNHYVYLSPNSGDLFYRMNHQLEESSRQFTAQTPRELIPMAPHRLLVLAINGELEEFDVKAMRAVKPAAELHNGRIQPGRSAASGRLLFTSSSIIERNTGDVLRLQQTELISVVEPTGRSAIGAISNAASRGWGRVAEGNSLRVSGGPVMTQLRDHSILSMDYPLALSLSRQSTGLGETLSIKYTGLADGSVLHAQRVSRVERRGAAQPYSMRQTQMLALGKSVLIPHQDTLKIATIPSGVIEQAAVPPHFAEKQQLELRVGGKKPLAIAVAGERGRTTLTSLHEFPGLSGPRPVGEKARSNQGLVVSNPKENELTLDTDLLWKALEERVADHLARSNAWSEFLSQERAKYQQLMGRELDEQEFAAKIPLELQLSDEEGLAERMSFEVLLRGPVAPLMAAVDARRKAADDERKLREAAILAARAAREMAQQAKQPEVASDKKRLDALEARLRRLEAAVDQILRRLDEAKDESR